MSKIGPVGGDYLWRAAASPAVIAVRARAWQLLGLLPGARVLDIGCGPGTATLGLASQVGMFGAVVGVDSDLEMVKTADAAARAAGIAGWARHQQGDATALPFPQAHSTPVTASGCSSTSIPSRRLRRWPRRPG